MIFALQFLIGYIYGHFLEWFLHKDVLHRYGKKRGGPFSFHFRSHHRDSKMNEFKDPSYSAPLMSWDSATKEIAALSFLVLLHVPVYFYAPGLFAACIFSVVEYYVKHRKAHEDPEWAKRKLVWHYDHHMGKIQDANWGVRSDLVDRLLGTRIH